MRRRRNRQPTSSSNSPSNTSNTNGPAPASAASNSHGGGGSGPQARRNGQQAQQGSRQTRNAKPKGSFWGDPTAEAAPPAPIRPSTQPAAVVSSLGPPPLGTHDKVAEHYFVAIYDKAVGLASALAAAGGLLETGDPDDVEPGF